MSGDTPTPKPSLDCPGCGSKVFIRETAAWFTDDEELCAGCGSRVMVALDEDGADPDLLTARVYIYEHGGEVVARLTEERDAIWAERVEEGKVAARAGREAADLRGRVAVVEAERNVARRMYVESGFTRKETRREKARDFATRLGWTDLYLDGTPTDATPSEPGNAEYIAWSDGGMVGPAPGHGEPEQ